MHAGLHGRGALFDTGPPGLVPRLVGLRPHQMRATPLEHAGTPPLLVLAGGHGLGKTAVLEELWHAYQEDTRKGEALGHTPLALVDCADPRFAEPPGGQGAESWSPLWQALLVVAEQLTHPVKAAGRVAFPRLMSGLVAVIAGDWRHADSARIRRELERILLLNEGNARLTHFASRWAGKVAAKVVAAASNQDPFVAAAIEATLESLTEGFVRRRQLKESTWYRSYPNAGGNAKRGLILLSAHFRAGGTSREHAERYLVRALLADLADAYAGRMSHLTRLGRPLVLLDNAGAGPGPGLLDAVLRDRAEGMADQVVFVAAVRGTGRPPLRNAVRRTLPDVARRTAWEPGTSPSSRALVVTLTPLSADDTLHIVGAVCEGAEVPPRLPHAVHRLTGGNPLGIDLLARTARQHPSRAGSLASLLTARVVLTEDQPDDGRHAHLELLDRLVPADHLDELTVLAAAHDHDSACALAAALLPDDVGPSRVRALEALLADEGLPAAPGHFVGDPFVRALLLLRLHHRPADHGKWRETHETLIRHYTPEDTGDGTPPPTTADTRHRLYHELALGDTESAVAHLRDTFTVLDPRDWLDTLCFLTSAPYFHAHDATGQDFAGHDDRRAAVALGRADSAVRPPPGADPALHLRVRRLLHAAWQAADPLVLPDPDVCDRLRFELERLSDLRPAGNELLWRASRDWPANALAGRPLCTPRAGAGPGDADTPEGDA
ncbi:hypothetical protein ACIQU5_26140 [Streptomyces sp. NPDC090306]|uniref:hypothetical protein n=1 Tax=Streptomyces sp. NPDC090306 TaxID=3365961 RepID=UPI00381FDEB0